MDRAAAVPSPYKIPPYGTFLKGKVYTQFEGPVDILEKTSKVKGHNYTVTVLFVDFVHSDFPMAELV